MIKHLRSQLHKNKNKGGYSSSLNFKYFCDVLTSPKAIEASSVVNVLLEEVAELALKAPSNPTAVAVLIGTVFKFTLVVRLKLTYYSLNKNHDISFAPINVGMPIIPSL